MYQDVMIAGFGGQGILVTGKLLARAGMLEGRHVTWFPSYGAEIRGGTANCTVVISDHEIGSPVVRNPSAMLILNAASLVRFQGRIRSRGMLYLNTSLVPARPGRTDVECVEIRANEIAEEIGDGRVANMVMLGAFLKRSGIATVEAAIAALRQVLPVRRHSLIPLNEAALQHGARLG